MLSVIFSSHNGERTVGRMLDACCALAPPEGGWELIAVDNASGDRTGEIMRSFEGRLPIQVLHVPTRGKNRALNAALEHVKGDLVVFTDDDVIPDAHWLAILEAASRSHPDVDMFAGPILPIWPREPDPWILRTVFLEMVFSISRPDLQEGPIPATLVWGANMAVRRKVFDASHRFDAAAGPDGSIGYMMGSETEFTRRIEKAGGKAWLCVGARVGHIIREEQFNTAWMLQRYFRHGRSAYYFGWQGPPHVPKLFGVERWLLAQLVASRVKASLQRLRGNREEWFKSMALYHATRGGIHQSRVMHRAFNSRTVTRSPE